MINYKVHVWKLVVEVTGKAIGSEKKFLGGEKTPIYKKLEVPPHIIKYFVGTIDEAEKHYEEIKKDLFLKLVNYKSYEYYELDEESLKLISCEKVKVDAYYLKRYFTVDEVLYYLKERNVMITFDITPYK